MKRPELIYPGGEDSLAVARRASDLLEATGHEREAADMRRRVMSALEAERGAEGVLGVLSEFVELLPLQ